MNYDIGVAKTPATYDEIRRRVAHALQRHPLCREIRFEIMRTPPNRRGRNWTISLSAVGSEAIWEASEIVADIQDAYDLAAV